MDDLVMLHNAPVAHDVAELAADAVAELGDTLAAADLGTGRRTVQIAAGDLHACDLLDDGRVHRDGVGQVLADGACLARERFEATSLGHELLGDGDAPTMRILKHQLSILSILDFWSFLRNLSASKALDADWFRRIVVSFYNLFPFSPSRAQGRLRSVWWPEAPGEPSAWTAR